MLTEEKTQLKTTLYTSDSQGSGISIDIVREVRSSADVSPLVLRLRGTYCQRPHPVINYACRQLTPILSRPCQRVYQLYTHGNQLHTYRFQQSIMRV